MELTKEQLFDGLLAEKVQEIVQIARENGIDFLIAFKIDERSDDDYGDEGPLYATTANATNSRVLAAALGVITGRYMPVPATAAMMLKLDDATTEAFHEAE